MKNNKTEHIIFEIGIKSYAAEDGFQRKSRILRGFAFPSRSSYEEQIACLGVGSRLKSG
jgi:hypothetical protein